MKDRHIKKLNQEIQNQLNSSNYDIIKILTLNQEKDICKDWDHLRWYQQALINLDERVSDGDNDKPEIRSMLLVKIQQLKSKV